MSKWITFDMDTKVAGILNVKSHAPRHHFGRPFLTPYQIAIEFKNRYPADFRAIGKPVGGKNTGQHNSLAQYIALELSRKIKSRAIQNIEGRFLHRANLNGLKYQDGGRVITSSTMTSCDLSMFRLLED